MSHPKLLALVLAGGKGERLFPLTAMRSKPSVPFGGSYRIVDFVLSNIVNSHIYSIYLLVQYKSQSLIEHIRRNWVLSPIVRDHFITVVPPQMRLGPEWFQGTADAVLQNANLIMDHNPGLVIVFGSDHIYRMDIRQMVDFHMQNNAAVTVAARPVPIEQASAFGCIQVDPSYRITQFQEKPKNPPCMPGDPTRAFVSMGNYIFNTEVLVKALADAQSKKQNDFGSHIIPDLVADKKKVFAYDFATNVIPGTLPHEEPGYWRDVGTIEAFFNAHMDMLGDKPAFEISNPYWPIFSGTSQYAPVKIKKGAITNSILAPGVSVNGAKIKNSIIRGGVTIERGAEIEDCILMDNVIINKNAKLKRVIVDKHNVIEEGAEIGLNPAKDRFRCHMDVSGIGIVPRGGKISKPDKAK